MRRSLISLTALAVALAGCNMAPKYIRPEAAAPAAWPQGAAYAPAEAGEAGMPWRTLFADPRLQAVIETALANNQNLAASLANVASARAQYHVERSYQLPTIAAGADASAVRGLKSSVGDTQSYSANAGFSAFELDLFGRLKNQSREQLETYLATESGYRSARLTLVANAATAYVTLAADRDLLAIAEQTRASGQRSVDLTQSLFKAGLAAAGDVASARTVLEQANSDVASQTTLVAQDRNALELLVGAPVADAQLPTSMAQLETGIGQVPAGLSSQVLLQRPDVVEAEHELQATYAQIGAARAAFFPQISLTSALGLASTALASLFTGDAFSASGTASASLPLLGGANKGNLEYARAQREYYLASYRGTVQSAFRDVADALARRGTITDQRGAQERLVAAARKSYNLADAQYRAGTDTFINALVAQRSLYAYQQTRVATVLADLTNRVAVYSAIGADESLGEGARPFD
ncbi:multidrug transporter [Novosphingobium barchaimii LL02]|uniref:Multidrug transporter n=1 Tax=Novosphingobium barchaimii LL02 TaxID=1114963 RepID=A0A0J7XFP7_9SPHN|nr:efflux transporter outer membrane subunit [Novosphingobium barchaimii]KMS50504.1 multidrug transporter [Novosphingobium barchaimii LL02]